MSALSENQSILADLYRYNAWANALVFAACAALDPTILREDARGTSGTIESTLKHLVGVEDAYLAMLQGLPIGQAGAQETYLAQDITWFAQRASIVGEMYLELLAHEIPIQLGRALVVPWFSFPVTRRDGLLQVLSHSAQHRAQVLTTLGAQGLGVPNIDYVFMVGTGAAPSSGG